LGEGAVLGEGAASAVAGAVAEGEEDCSGGGRVAPLYESHAVEGAPGASASASALRCAKIRASVGDAVPRGGLGMVPPLLNVSTFATEGSVTGLVGASTAAAAAVEGAVELVIGWATLCWAALCWAALCWAALACASADSRGATG
jgi:hypothetical protein